MRILGLGVTYCGYQRALHAVAVLIGQEREQVVLDVRDFVSMTTRVLSFMESTLMTGFFYRIRHGYLLVFPKDPFFVKGKPYYLDLQVKDKVINIDEELIVIYCSVLKYLQDKFKFHIQLCDIPSDLCK